MSRVLAGLLVARLLSGCGGAARPSTARVPANGASAPQPVGTGDVVGVVHGKPGLLLPTVTVIIELSDRSLDTIDDADGHFVLHDVPAGSHVVNVYCGDQRVQRKVEVRPGTRTELDVTIDQTKPAPETILRAASPS